jgi:hypothetical protein
VNRSFTCVCGQPIFFRNSVCLGCHAPLGYDPVRGKLLPLAPTDTQDVWRSQESVDEPPLYRRCTNLASPATCNWLVPLQTPDEFAPDLCQCCRLTRTVPDLSVPEHATWWGRIELAKRRLASSLLALRLPLVPRSEDAEKGLAFDILTTLPGAAPVITGHASGVITLDACEADDATRELRRTSLREPYRTLLGHLRHETGHYYWERLVNGTPWHEPFRAVFGDERADYGQALQNHYLNGAPPDWSSRHVTAYASCHPWEDWAETWAHYLHMRDTLGTARGFGIRGDRVELACEPFGPSALSESSNGEVTDARFLQWLNHWLNLTVVLNEMSRSMGVPDFYPFVLSQPAVRKLHLVHRIISHKTPRSARRRTRPAAPAQS